MLFSLHQHNCNDWSQVNFSNLYKIVVKNVTLLNNSSAVPAIRRDCQENPTRKHKFSIFLLLLLSAAALTFGLRYGNVTMLQWEI